MNNYNAYNYYPYNPYLVKEAEYKALRAHSKRVGICLMLYVILQQVFLFVLAFFGFYGDFLNNPSFQYSANVLFFSFACMFVPFFFASRKQGFLGYWQVLPFNPPEKKGKAVLLVLTFFAVCISANYVASFVETVLSGIGLEEYEPQINESTSPVDVALNFLCAAVSAPLIEEFVFRGVIMQPLRRYGEHFAVFASALLFGFAHSSPTGFVFAFISGVAIGYAVILSKSLWVGIAIHFCNNFYSVLISELYTAYPELNSAVVLALIGIIIAIGFVSFIVLIAKKEIKFEKSGSLLKTRAKIKGFFLSVPMVLALAAFVYYIFQSINS